MGYIFVHGLGQDASSWNEVISCMDTPSYVITPELADLLLNKEATYKNLYEAFSEYCNGISEPLNLCGLSLGAVLVLNYAIDYPSKVNSLVLIGGQYQIPKLLINIQTIIMRCMKESSFYSIGFNKKEFIQLTRSMVDLNLSSELGKIKCPTLVLCGEKDHANKGASQGLARHVSVAELQIIEEAGHEVNTEAPKKLAEILKAFYMKFSIVNQ